MTYLRKIRIMLEKPEKYQNIGAVIRNIYSFDAGTLFIPKDAPLHLNCKSACGTGNKIQIQKLEDYLEFLKKTHFRKIGFVVNQTQQYPTSIPITDFNHRYFKSPKEREKKFKDNDLLIFGCESRGLSNEAIELCDILITIPMLGHMACLNLANTTGIALYEVMRQRLENGSIVLKTKPKLSKHEKYMKQTK